MLCETETYDSVEEERRAREARRLREVVYRLQAGNLPEKWDPSLGLAGGYQPGTPVPQYLVAGICLAEGINIDRAIRLNRTTKLLARRYRYNGLRSFSCQLPSGQIFVARPLVVNRKPIVYITVGDEMYMSIPSKSCLALTPKGYRLVRSEMPAPKSQTAHPPDRGELGKNAQDGQLKPLTESLQPVWDLLDGRFQTSKDLAKKLLDDPTKQDLIRKRVDAIRKTGRDIKTFTGFGYYRPDAPQPDLPSHPI